MDKRRKCYNEAEGQKTTVPGSSRLTHSGIRNVDKDPKRVRFQREERTPSKQPEKDGKVKGPVKINSMWGPLGPHPSTGAIRRSNQCPETHQVPQINSTSKCGRPFGSDLTRKAAVATKCSYSKGAAKNVSRISTPWKNIIEELDNKNPDLSNIILRNAPLRNLLSRATPDPLPKPGMINSATSNQEEISSSDFRKVNSLNVSEGKKILKMTQDLKLHVRSLLPSFKLKHEDDAAGPLQSPLLSSTDVIAQRSGVDRNKSRVLKHEVQQIRKSSNRTGTESRIYTTAKNPPKQKKERPFFSKVDINLHSKSIRATETNIIGEPKLSCKTSQTTMKSSTEQTEVNIVKLKQVPQKQNRKEMSGAHKTECAMTGILHSVEEIEARLSTWISSIEGIPQRRRVRPGSLSPLSPWPSPPSVLPVEKAS